MFFPFRQRDLQRGDFTMGGEMRDTGIEILGKILWGTHFCLFHKNKEELSEILVPYFKAGLENNEYCMWITSEILPKKEAEALLNKAIPHFENYLKNHQMEIIPYTEWYLLAKEFNSQRVINGWLKKLEDALHQGYEGVRITGSLIWLEKRIWKNFVNYETEINAIIPSLKMIVICSYSLEKCGAFEIIDITHNHKFVLIHREGAWEIVNNMDHLRAEEKLRKAIEELKELDRLKDAFYADISHEYRTPLTAIKGFTELLLQYNNLNKNQEADLEAILRNEARLERLVDDILAYSRLKSGRIPFNREIFRASDVFNELKKELAPLLEAKQLNIETEFSPDDELIFDRFQISKLIRNFFSNAIKFSFSGGKILIKSTIKDGVWTFSMRDFGVGIAAVDLPKLFSRFVKLEASIEMNSDGIGIGLAICKSIIDVYEGKIWVDSDGPNKGSTFIFQLEIK